jgi:hypothetical protein
MVTARQAGRQASQQYWNVDEKEVKIKDSRLQNMYVYKRN